MLEFMPWGKQINKKQKTPSLYNSHPYSCSFFQSHSQKRKVSNVKSMHAKSPRWFSSMLFPTYGKDWQLIMCMLIVSYGLTWTKGAIPMWEILKVINKEHITEDTSAPKSHSLKEKEDKDTKKNEVKKKKKSFVYVCGNMQKIKKSGCWQHFKLYRNSQIFF